LALLSDAAALSGKPTTLRGAVLGAEASIDMAVSGAERA